MAYALLAGMPPIYGLYTSMVPLLIYALLATSTKLSVGPVAVSALLVLEGVSKLAVPGTEEYISLVILTGLLVGVIQLGLGLLRMGFLVNFISHPVIAGFTSAAAIIIIISQLKDVLGIEILNSGDSISTFISVCQQCPATHWLTLIISILSFVIILVLKKINKKIPGPLLVVLVGIILSYYAKLNDHGVAIIGDIPSGLPSFQLPLLDLEAIKILIPTVLTVTLIGIVESLGIAKSLESKYKDHKVSADQELLALGIAKISGSFFNAIPSSGSFSRSAINGENGAKTPVSSIVTVVLITLTLLFFTDIFSYLPKAILAAIILLAVINLFDIKEAKFLWKTNRLDFVMMAATFLLTLAMGIEAGVFFGVLLSILAVLYKSSVPNISYLGQIPGTNYFRNIKRFEEAYTLPNTLIMRFESQLFFGNASFFRDSVLKSIEKHHEAVHHIIIDGSIIHDIDSTAVHVLQDLSDQLDNDNIGFHLAGVVGSVRDKLYKANLLTDTGKHHMNIYDAVNYIHNPSEVLQRRAAHSMQTNER